VVREDAADYKIVSNYRRRKRPEAIYARVLILNQQQPKSNRIGLAGLSASKIVIDTPRLIV